MTKLKEQSKSQFNNLQDSHNKSIDIIRASLLKATQSTPSEHAISDSESHVSDGGEGIEMLDQMPNPKNDDEMRRAREEEAKIIKRNGEFMEKVEEVDDEEVNIVRRNDEVGNNVEVEGCAFHLAQAWNRRRDTCNMRKFMQGHGRVLVVAEWWDTIKGVIFLPKRLYPEVRALWRPPVPEDHVAYEKCKEFLEYLHSTWFDGPYKNLWNKWELVDLRTTNIAEAYHNRLNVEFGRDHPDLRTLIEKLKYIDFEA
ncbi:hypothetical protein V3C99_008087 [Haemonchus contortus]